MSRDMWVEMASEPLSGDEPYIFLAMAAIVTAGLCVQAIRARCADRLFDAGMFRLLPIFVFFVAGNGLFHPHRMTWVWALVSLLCVWTAAVIVGARTAARVWARPRRDVSAEAELARSRDDRARQVGEAGERLVACELAALGWPVLHNVILIDERGRTAEIDHLVRASDGILVLETKTYAGFVDGVADAPCWTQHLSGGRSTAFLNPAIQNLGHVSAVERFVADPFVRVRGFVVSAGTARFAEAIAHIPVPRHALRGVLRDSVQVVMIGQEERIDAAWRRLEREAARSARHHAGHEAYGRRRRRVTALGT